MRDRFSGSMITVVIAAAAVSAGIISLSTEHTSAQAPAAAVTAPASALKTPWGEPDLQGIWTVETDTPFQRSPKYANQEFFTEAERAEFDRVRAALRGRDERGDRGSERDVSGAYNAVWGGRKRTGARTSLIVDPPDGRSCSGGQCNRQVAQLSSRIKQVSSVTVGKPSANRRARWSCGLSACRGTSPVPVRSTVPGRFVLLRWIPECLMAALADVLHASPDLQQ